MDSICLSKKSGAFGTVNLPGSKSLSNRALLLSALSSGTTELKNLLKSDDTDRMTEALTALGISVERSADRSCRVTGDPSRTFTSGDLFLGNAGTAMRPLTAVLAADGNDGILEPLHQRCCFFAMDTLDIMSLVFFGTGPRY